MAYCPVPGISLHSMVFACLCVFAIRADHAEAHAVYQAFLRHDVRCEVGAENIDITVELTFHEFPSIAERRLMDADHSGTITAAESERYLRRIADVCEAGILMTIDGRPVDVMVLHDPRIDLLGVAHTMPTHHILRLYYFARTPPWFTSDSRIVIRNQLWPDLPAIESFEAAGHEGVTVVTGKPAEAANPAQTSVNLAPAAFQATNRMNWAGAARLWSVRVGVVLVMGLAAYRWLSRQF